MDRTEAATLLFADWGESLRVNGMTVTGTFTLGSSETDGREDQNGPGRSTRKTAVASLPATADVNIDDEVVRLADDSVWIVDDFRKSNDGTTICELRTSKQRTTGMI